MSDADGDNVAIVNSVGDLVSDDDSIRLSWGTPSEHHRSELGHSCEA